MEHSNTIVSKTGAYSLTTTDDTVLTNANGGAFTLTLPSPSSKMGKIFTIKKIDTTGNKVTISGSIDGLSSSVGLVTPNRSIQLQSDGSVWRTINGNNTVPYAFMYNTTASMPSTAGTVQIAFNTNSITSGITHTASGTIGGGGGDIIIRSSGVYHVHVLGTLNDATTATAVGGLWLEVNGVAVPYGGGAASVLNVKQAADLIVDTVLPLNSGDTLRVYYTTASANLKLISETLGSSNYPSVALTIYRIGG